MMRAEGAHERERDARAVLDAVNRLREAVPVDDVVLGGGNVKYVKRLPNGVRRGSNANAARGGMILWVAGSHVAAATCRV
jgi:polyphosphate glucokinase